MALSAGRAQGLSSCCSPARGRLCGHIAPPASRSATHYEASTSGAAAASHAAVRATPGAAARRRRVVARALFDPPPFQPEKLAVLLATGTTPLHPAPPLSRKYTLTHNDLTGSLRLTIGPEYNQEQISGFYTRLLRDEVVAEWVRVGSSAYALHVYCHVSGEERWLAPPLLRNYIFRREMPLVLDTLAYADRQLLRALPELDQAQVYIHFQSSVRELDTVEFWGILGDRSTWPKGPTSILLRMIYAIVGWPPSLDALPADLSIDLPSELRDVEEAIAAARLLQQQRLQQEALAQCAGGSAGELASGDGERDAAGAAEAEEPAAAAVQQQGAVVVSARWDEELGWEPQDERLRKLLLLASDAEEVAAGGAGVAYAAASAGGDGFSAAVRSVSACSDSTGSYGSSGRNGLHEPSASYADPFHRPGQGRQQELASTGTAAAGAAGAAPWLSSPEAHTVPLSGPAALRTGARTSPADSGPTADACRPPDGGVCSGGPGCTCSQDRAQQEGGLATAADTGAVQRLAGAAVAVATMGAGAHGYVSAR